MSDSMSQLLASVQENTQKYLDYFTRNGLAEPTFEHGDGIGYGDLLPPEIRQARATALEATDELHHLLLGPFELILSAPGDQYLMLAIQYIYRYSVPIHVPRTGEISYQDLATAAGANVTDLTRILRVAIGRHIFHETREGFVKHTAASLTLLGNILLEHWTVAIAQEFGPSVPRVVDATVKWPGSEEPNECGYSLGHNTDAHAFDVIKRDPARLQRFADLQSFSHLHESYSMDYLLSGYDFSNVQTLVDIGGSHGQVSIALAKKYPHITCIVQDQPSTIAGLSSNLPDELKGRVKGMEHDFLSPQPVSGADVYLLRWILHDWSDKYCVKILRAIIPGLVYGARVVINDICIPEMGELGIMQDRSLRKMDISMKAFNNARERDAKTWAWLLGEADHRYKLLRLYVPPGARMAIIEAEWQGLADGQG